VNRKKEVQCPLWHIIEFVLDSLAAEFLDPDFVEVDDLMAEIASNSRVNSDVRKLPANLATIFLLRPESLLPFKTPRILQARS